MASFISSILNGVFGLGSIPFKFLTGLLIGTTIKESSCIMNYNLLPEDKCSLFLIYDGIVTCPLLVIVAQCAFIRYHNYVY
jgi:hypothetical protein